jgi:hypothetical protein
VQGDGGPARPELSSLIGHFVGHVCIGFVGFVALAIPAVLFSLAAHYLEGTTVSRVVVDVLVDLTYFMLGVDTLTFVLYVLFSMCLAARALFLYMRDL